MHLPPRGLPGTLSESLSTSEWADVSKIEAHTCVFRPGAFFVGQAHDRYIGFDDDRHLLTVAGSRAGKGTSLIVPNLLFWPGSTIVTDPKGELATITARCRAEGIDSDIPAGRVFALDPFEKVVGAATQFRASFNPLSMIVPDSETGHEIAGIIADTLVIQNQGEGAHWTQAARAFLRGLILYVAKTEPPDRANLIRMRALLLDIISDGQKSPDLHTMKQDPGMIGQAAKGLLGKPPNERGSVLSTCEVQTEFLSDPAMERVLKRSDFAIEDLKDKRTAVYLCLPAGRLGTHGRWFRLMVGLAMDTMERTGPLRESQNRVLFCLDEFAALGYMQAIEKAAGQIAGFGVKLWTILQDLTQIQKDYGPGWETFMGNAGLMTFWGNTDLTTAKHISERLGQVSVRTIAESRNIGTNVSTGTMTPGVSLAAMTGSDYRPQVGSESIGEQKTDQTTTNRTVQLVPMLSPAEVIRFFARERGNMLVIHPFFNPIIVERCDYWREEHDPVFGGLYDPRPDELP